MPSAVKSSFDVAFWFLDTALNNNEYLAPQKLQRLMFLAQAYYAAFHRGRKLIPALFVADEMGPLEPTTYAAFANGRPSVDADVFLSAEAERILEGVWRRFGHHSAEHLTRLTKNTPAYRQAWQRAPRAEIALRAMALSFIRAADAPSPDQIVRPKVLRTQSGRAVTVRRWAPGEKLVNAPASSGVDGRA